MRLIHSKRSPRAVVLLVVAASLLGWSLRSPAASAATPSAGDVGDVVVVDAADGSKALTHGDASTAFSLRLPAGSTCPGDSAHDQWRVQSFLIPTTDDPTAIRYGPIGPEPTDDGRFALFLTDTRPYVHQLTQSNGEGGQPGVIRAIPAISFAVVADEKLPSGDYRIGIACTYFGNTNRYWDAVVVITDDDGRLSWRLASVSADEVELNSGSGSSGVAWLVGAVVLCLAAVGLILHYSRTGRSRPATLTKGTR